MEIVRPNYTIAMKTTICISYEKETEMRICWYCGSYGNLVRQPDGNLLHDNCRKPAERDYPDRPTLDTERADTKVSWQDVQDREDDADAFWA